MIQSSFLLLGQVRLILIGTMTLLAALLNRETTAFRGWYSVFSVARGRGRRDPDRPPVRVRPTTTATSSHVRRSGFVEMPRTGDTLSCRRFCKPLTRGASSPVSVSPT